MRSLTISTSVRPGRVAVLVDAKDPQWQSTCLRIIEYFTRMWGGCGNIIVPTDGKQIGPLFWRILERFDPDYLEAYKRTGRDLEIEEPAKFEEMYRRHIAGWEKQIGENTSTFAAEKIRDDLRHASLAPFEISAELQQELKERLAPFHFQQWIVEAGAVVAGSVPHHPHTDIVDILPQIERPPRVLKVDDRAVLPPLWWASSFGRVNGELQAELAKMNLGVSELGSTADEAALLIHLAVKGYEDISSAAFLTKNTAETIYEKLQSLPARLSMAGLGFYRSVRYSDATELVVAVAGTNVEDFALYYALSRMRTRVLWIPPSVTADALAQEPKTLAIDERFHFVNDLASLARGNTQRYGGMRLISATLPDPHVEEVRARLSETAIGHVDCQMGIASEMIPIYPVRHHEANNASVLRSIAIPDDGVIPLFETPLPKNFKAVNPQKHRWLTELNISRYHLPRHHVLGERLMGAPSFTAKDLRISCEGPTYFCPSFMVFGGASAESSVPRPSIRIPEPLDIFIDVARPCGLSCSISDKGFYAENACQKFGGLAPLAEFLRSQSGQSFASAFLDKTNPGEGEHLKGAVLGDRRYFDLGSLSEALGSERRAAKLLDHLALSAVVYRGFVLKCQYCKRADWFPLSELTDSFTCKRCHRGQVFTHRHWRHPSQPHLYYQLDELVYLGLEHNMQVPLLALDLLRRTSQDSFLHVPELEYREKDADKPAYEVDLNCVVDGLLTIGEAKKDDRLGKNEKEESQVISKYLDLGKKLAVQQIVFATGSEQWHPSTIERITNAFADRRFRLILQVRKDLYGGEGGGTR